MASERASRARRRSRLDLEDRLTWLVAAGAALVAASFDDVPVGIGAADVVVRMGAAAIATLVVSQGPRWSWCVYGVAAALLTVGPWFWVGVATAVAAFAALQLPRRSRAVGALIAAAATIALFHQQTTDVPTGVPTLVALAGLGPAAWSAYATLRTNRQRRIRVAVAWVGGAVVVVGAAGFVSALVARAHVQSGVRASREAVELVRADDSPGATSAFARAAGKFDAAADAVSAPWALPARVLPVVSQHLVAIDDLARAGERVADAGARTLPDFDLDAVQVADGRIDLDQIIGFRDPAQHLLDAAVGARAVVDTIDSPWLLSALTSRVEELSVDLDDAITTARDTVDALDAAPWLLGADATRDYLVLFTTPSEARELGGITGAYGVLTVDDGELSFEAGGSAASGFPELREIDASLPQRDLPALYRAMNPQVFAQNWTGVADFPTVSATVQSVLGSLGRSYDGVVLVDPRAVTELASYSGPVDIPGIDRRIAPDDLLQFLLREQYLLFEEVGQGERKEYLAEVADEVFATLIDGALPGPRQLFDDLGPLVEQRRLLFTVNDPEVDALLARHGVNGALAPPAGEGVEGITLAVTNSRRNKLDAYMGRSVTFTPAVADDGTLSGDLVVTLHNDVPAISTLNDYVSGDKPLEAGGFEDGLPPGTWEGIVTVYSTLRMTTATVEGANVLTSREELFGMGAVSATVLVDHGESVAIRFHVDDEVHIETP